MKPSSRKGQFLARKPKKPTKVPSRKKAGRDVSLGYSPRAKNFSAPKRRPMDFCSVHDVLLQEALTAPMDKPEFFMFTVTFHAQRVATGVVVDGLHVSRRLVRQGS